MGFLLMRLIAAFRELCSKNWMFAEKINFNATYKLIYAAAGS